MERPTKLDSSTLIPLGALSLVFGAAMWLTSIWKQGEANASQIQEVKHDQEKNLDKVYQKLEKIDGKIDQLMEKRQK
jgi:hypothetical protein